MSAPLRPLAALLVEAVRGSDAADLCEPLRGTSAEKLLGAGRLHRVTPAVERVVRSWDRPPDGWLPMLTAVKHHQLVRHLRSVAELRGIGAVLDAADIPWVAVKGPVLAGAVWPAPNMREYFDLDVVVDRRRFADALEALTRTGATLVDRNWPEIRRTGWGELSLRTAAGTPLDLHWHIAVPAALRRDFAIDVEGMLDRRRPIELGGAVVPTLDPEDTVVHLAFHAAQAGANRLMWLADVGFALAAADVAQVERRARAAGVWLPVRMVLDRVHRVLGLPEGPVPAGGLPLWARVTRLRDGRTSFPGLPGDPWLGGAEYAAARTGVLDSAAALVRYRRVVGRHEAERAAGTFVEQPLQLDVPDEAARAAYLRDVARGAASVGAARGRRDDPFPSAVRVGAQTAQTRTG